MYSYLFLYISTVTMIKSAYASCLRNDISSTDTRKCLRGLRNHENFQVLRLRALFPVPLSSYSFHFKKNVAQVRQKQGMGKR